MSGDATDKNWQGAGLMDQGPRNLLADITDTLSYLSSENRDERRKQKFREALVREYIEDKKQPASLLQTVVGKLVKSQ